MRVVGSCECKLQARLVTIVTIMVTVKGALASKVFHEQGLLLVADMLKKIFGMKIRKYMR